MDENVWSRRRFATAALTAAGMTAFTSKTCWAGALGVPASADSLAERWIELVNTHTREVVSVAFANAAGFIPEALASLQYLLRDFRREEQHPIDPALYWQLSNLARVAGREPRYEVISGYRSPLTNQQLRAGGHGVAEHSLHVAGRAIDVRLKGCKCSTLRDLALTAGRGGVGFYARSDFVHLDTGRVRFWRGS